MPSLFRCALRAFAIGGCAVALVASSLSSVEACFPCIDIPATPITPPVTITPVGVYPTSVVHKADEGVNQAAAPVVQKAGAAFQAVATSTIAPTVHIVGIITGKESLGQAGQQILASKGNEVSSIAEAVRVTNSAENGIVIVAADSIGGNVGKTAVTIATGPTQLQAEFATTTGIAAGDVIGGKLRPEELIAGPLAAGIRAAIDQYRSQARPVPDDVKAQLAGFYPPEVLAEARWVVGSLSISVPDVTNQFRKTVFGWDNAVTVGNITVFYVDPGSSYHWWAHELQHQVQYHQLGIDKFAYKYVTSCHEVESEAEAQAQKAVPAGATNLGCSPPRSAAMSQKPMSVFLSCLGICSCLALFSCSRKGQPFDTLEQAVRSSLDFTRFDKTKVDDHFIAVVASEGGSHVFNRSDLENFVAHIQKNNEKYEVAGFKVLSKDESKDSIFASISYEVNWNVTVNNKSHATYAVYHDTWEREVDGWHRLAAAISSKTMPGLAGQVSPQNISAYSDEKGMHPAIAPIARSVKVTCVTATSDIPSAQSKPSCKINAPGFLGDLQVNATISTNDAGTLQLECGGQGDRLACTAQVH
jgi:hypothetical protein